MTNVVGLELPTAWTTAKPNDNVNFDISADQLNLTVNRQMDAGSIITWPTVLHKGLVDPVSAQDAATKNYVDTQIIGKDELSELNDVTITSRLANQVLVVNAGNTFWVNALLTNPNLASGVFANIVGIGVQTQNLDLDTFGIETATGALGALLKNDGTKYDDFLIGADNTILAVAGTDLAYQKIVNDLLTVGVFTAITGLGVQTQNLDLDTFGILTATGALGSLLKHDGTRYDDFAIGADNTILAVAGSNLAYEKIVNDLLTSGVFANIVGVGAQTQALDMGTNLVNNVVNPVSPQDAATKDYVDSIAINGVKWKEPCRVASTGNLTLAGEQTIDGVLTSTDRVLVKDQTLGEDNGVYVTAGGAWARSADTDTASEIETMATFIQEGTVNSDEGFVLTTDPPIILGTTVLVYAQFTGLGQITAGAGLTKTGNVLDVGGTSGRITVLADSVDIDATYIGQASITTLGILTVGTWQADVIAKAFLPTTTVFTDQANNFGSFNQKFKNNTLVLRNATDTNELSLTNVATSNTGVTFPDSSGIIVLDTFLQTLTNKTLVTPTIASFTNAQHDHEDASGGGLLLKAALPPTTVFNDQPNLYSAQPQRFPDDQLKIINPANTFDYSLRSSAIVADRDVTLPLLTVDDVFVMEAFIQTLTNKTFNLTDNTLEDTSDAQGDLIKHNGTKFVRFGLGTALQQLRVNAGVTDLEFFTPSVEMVDSVPCVLEAPQGVVAFPDVVSLATQGSKVSGFVLPDGASIGTINFKVKVPDGLASTPSAKIRVTIMTLAAVAGPADVRLTISTKHTADGEDVDTAFTVETEQTVIMPVTTETLDIFEQTLTNTPADGDFITGQLARDPTDPADDFTGDIIIVGIELIVTRNT